jgi:hypothetical protein
MPWVPALCVGRSDLPREVAVIKESTPNSPLANRFPPGDGRAYAVRSGDSWTSIANSVGLDPWQLIEFNFPFIAGVTPFDEKCRQVNWLMRTHVGCTTSRDGINYTFDSSDSPGWIYLPSDDGKVGFPEPVHLLAGLQERRQRVFAKAMEFYDEGAHFLLGSRAKILEAGHVHLSGEAVWLEKPITDTSEPMILTAGSLDQGKDRNLCVGRFGHPDVRGAGGGEIKASDPDLRKYLADLKTLKTPHSTWPSFKKGVIELTPRTFFEDGRNVIVLGEKCLGKRHVDCISLVNACCTAGGRMKFTYSISQYMNGKAGTVVMDREKGPKFGPKAKTADVVIKHKNHIGICGVDEHTGEITVIEATGAEKGIIKTKFRNTRELDSGKWKVRVRPLV